MEKQSNSPVSTPSSPSRNEAEGDSSSDKERIDQATQSPQQQQLCKGEDYRKLFHLPLEEILVQDFNCAFQKKILLQGHMYLFEQYVCFYSNIFGYEKKKVLPLKDVAFVRKAWTAGLFPNAIEIGAWGKKYFFASFLSRDEAYRLIIHGWSRHSGHARVELFSQSSVTTSLFTKISEITEQVISCTEDGDEKQVLPKSEESTQEQQQLVEAIVSESNDLVWKIEDTSPPPLSSEFKTIMETEFPVDVEDFFELFFSDNANGFAEMFHKRCSDEEFRSTNWSPHPRFGHARDISFRHPVNLYFGPKSAVCSETQRFRVYRDSHLVIETSQQMSDIPYADYFHVEVRWDVERVPKEISYHSSVRISMNVDFSKKTLWRSKIEQATLDECKETYSIWVREAYNILSSKTSRSSSGRLETTSESRPASEPGKAPDALLSPNTTNSVRLRSREITTFLVRGLHRFRLKLLRFFSENPMALVVLFIAALAILTQAATLVTISRRAPVPHQIGEGFHHQISENKCLAGGGSGSEAIAWLEQRARYVKEEITLAEARLQSLHQDLSLLKVHVNLFDQLNKAKGGP